MRIPFFDRSEEDSKEINQEETNQYGIEEEKDISNLENFLDTSSINSVFPFSWEEFPDHIESGDNYIRVLAIVGYPKTKVGNWLAPLKNEQRNITIVQNFESSNASQVVDYYNTTIKNKEAELIDTYDPMKEKRLEQQIETAYMQMNKYLDSEVTYLYQHCYVYLQADNLEELNALTDSVSNTLTKLQLKSMNPIKAQYQAFWSAMPIGENLLRDYTYQQSNTEVASSVIPFDDAEILDLNPYSDIEGVNKDTNSLIAIDYSDKRNVLNQNMVVIGTSGVGKTTYMKQKILRYVAKGTKVFIIDPENEYTDIVEHLGGEVVHLSSNSETKINPLEVFTEELDTYETVNMELLIKDKIQRVKGFFQVIKPDLSQVEKGVLDYVLNDVYRNSGVLNYTTIDDISRDQWPILADVYQQIERMKQSEEKKERFEIVRDFYFILDSYVNGSNTLFNGHTNIDVTTNLLSFDLKSLQNDTEIQSAAYLNTFSYLWDEITKNKTENIKLIVDEFHFLTQNPDASTFFYQAYKRFRKYNAGAIAGTQQIQDVLEGNMDNGKNVGQAIIGNSYTKVYFGLDNQGLEDIENKLSFQFYSKEKRLLKKKKQGEALLINGSKRALNVVSLTDEELRLIAPDQWKEQHSEITDYEKEIEMTPIEKDEAMSFQY